MLAVLIVAGLATVPTEGADRHLERPKPRVQIPAADRWRLRPTEPVIPSTTGSIRGRAEIQVPAERRNVRLVYPALIEPR
jgi:hypothetical protein